MSAIRNATKQEVADALGVTLDEYTADPLGSHARTLTTKTGIQHHVYLIAAEGLRPAKRVVYPKTCEDGYADAGITLQRIA